MTRYSRIHRAATEAAQRRRRLALWLEHFEAMNRTPTRTPEEARAKAEALELLHQGVSAIARVLPARNTQGWLIPLRGL